MLGNRDPLLLCYISLLWLWLIHGHLATARVIFNADFVRFVLEAASLFLLLNLKTELLRRGLLSLCAALDL